MTFLNVCFIVCCFYHYIAYTFFFLFKSAKQHVSHARSLTLCFTVQCSTVGDESGANYEYASVAFIFSLRGFSHSLRMCGVLSMKHHSTPHMLLVDTEIMTQSQHIFFLFAFQSNCFPVSFWAACKLKVAMTSLKDEENNNTTTTVNYIQINI